MILRRYGTTVQSVEPNFDARAMTEIGFRRDNALSIPADEFTRDYERTGGRELTAEATGDVKDEVEQSLLVSLLSQLRALEQEAGGSAVLLVENEAGKDQAKTRDQTTNVVERGENRMRFRYTVDPPLKVGVYRKR